MLSGNRVEDLSSANGLDGRIAADDKPVPFHQTYRGFQADLDRCGVTGDKFLPIQEHHMAEHLTGTGMEPYPGAGFGRFGIAGEKEELCVHHVAGMQGVRSGEDHPPG